MKTDSMITDAVRIQELEGDRHYIVHLPGYDLRKDLRENCRLAFQSRRVLETGSLIQAVVKTEVDEGEAEVAIEIDLFDRLAELLDTLDIYMFDAEVVSLTPLTGKVSIRALAVPKALYFQ